MSKKHLKMAAVIYAVVAVAYYYQAKQGGYNTSFSTALQWPFYAVKSPVNMLSILTGNGKSDAAGA